MSAPYRRRSAIVVLFFLISACIAGIWLAKAGQKGEAESPAPESATAGEEGAPAAKAHGVELIEPKAPRVLTGEFLPDGSPETVACATCHATRKPDPQLIDAGDLEDFHQGLTYNHGSLSCLSCHNAADYDALRLADGRSVAFPKVMTLCAQCHGPQHRDYTNGSHGGMTGYWDLTKGGRKRNNCVTCHDPHAPAYPRVMPVFKPIDTESRGHQRKAASGEESSPKP